MKTVVTRTITVWMSLMVVCLLFAGLSYAEIDPETAFPSGLSKSYSSLPPPSPQAHSTAKVTNDTDRKPVNLYISSTPMIVREIFTSC